ncbi:UNKNOWN [Stylonychia lemnae]|uniref:Transmembrane protein n=1 Tax=Stylonychia lemnae TaxID=5949 RepID=A0A078AYN5_STYLE|nr:UNKNOWN [Stylonychia lemnae]|eukprot:CDW87545.1 UNKNOWN [Stylonychia lemnae]
MEVCNQKSTIICSLTTNIVLGSIFYYYTFIVEKDEKCLATYISNTPQSLQLKNGRDIVDVSQNFDQVLKLYFWSIVVNVIQDILRLFFFSWDNRKIKNTILMLSLAYLVQLYAFVMNNIYRLRHEGMVCSGDYQTDEQKNEEFFKLTYIEQRGQFLWVFLIVNWTMVACGLCILLLCLAQSDSFVLLNVMQGLCV